MITGIHYIGVTHRTTSLCERERLRFDSNQLHDLLRRLDVMAQERIVLSTCERFEVYLFVGDPPRDSRTGVCTTPVGMDLRLPVPYFPEAHLRLTGWDAARHLIRVAAGLDSRILGEPHVLGQVRQAFAAAREAEALGPMLHALVRAAIHAGRRVRSETTLNGSGRSIVSITLDSMDEDFGLLQDRTILILGTGRLAHDLAYRLAARRASLIIGSGDVTRAKELGCQVGGMGIAFAKLPGVIGAVDGVVACTAHDGVLVDIPMLRSRPARRLRIWDLCVPRVVSPRVAEFHDVSLIHLEELVRLGRVGFEGVRSAEQIVDEELVRFKTWSNARRVIPDITRCLRWASRRQALGRPISHHQLHQRITRIKSKVAA